MSLPALAAGCLPSTDKGGDTFSIGEQPGCAHRELPRAEGEPAVVGTTSFATHDDIAPCARSVGRDLRYLWRPDTTARYRIHTAGSRFDTVLFVMEGCDGPVVACNDDTNDLTSTVTVSASAGRSYVIVVDGYERSDFGDFQLSVAR